MKILLGFEVGTGNEVFLEDGHTVVTGITQLSGKTTCLEALSERGGVTAVTFLTKRGESGFRNQREIQPYFKEQKRGNLIDWQYVEAILEATMGEKMKIERSFIIDCCNGSGRINIPPAKSLEEVYNNFKAAQKDATRGLDQSIYTNLAAYFEIILPQIRKYDFAEKLSLRKGFNVMNLIGMQDEMQQLVIESTMSYVLKKMENIIIVLPEAHKFIPQGRKTPVKNTAVRFIQEGATLGNFMWIDTQATTTVDKNLLKQCSNWIMGYQQEKNEVANVRENIGKHIISEKDIMSLKLGHFIASLQQKIYHVYVLPTGVHPSIGENVALEKVKVEEVRDTLERVKTLSEDETPLLLEDAVEPRKRWEVTEESLFKQIDALQGRTNELERTVEEAELQVEKVKHINEELKEENQNLKELIDSMKVDIKAYQTTIEDLNEELILFKALQMLLAQIIGPKIELPELPVEELKKLQEQIDKLKVRPRPVKVPGDTGITWIDIWMPKLSTPEQAIVQFMATRFPLKMTKSEVAIGCGLTASGGYFNGAFNKLVKNKLIILADEAGNYKLAETTP